MDKFLLAFLSAGVSAASLAAPISPEAALSRAMADAPAKPAGLDAASMKLNFIQYYDAIPAVYIFTASQGRGYVAVAADDTSTPLLGYSPDGMIPANREEMPDGLSVTGSRLSPTRWHGMPLIAQTGS